MTLKVIQINILKGKFLDRLVDFLRREQPDIITMQEVTGGIQNHWPDKNVDVFAYLQEALAMDGVVAPSDRIQGDARSYSGNAMLTRGTLRDHAVVWLRPYQEYPTTDDGQSEETWPWYPRNVIDARITFGEHTIHALATHGAWGREPVDTPEKIRQATILAEHLMSLKDEPFILGGDFNMESGSETIARIDAVARNCVAGSSITNTLNLRTHYAAAKLGDGRCVDFIYTSPHFRVVSIDTPDVDVSDHFPVRAVLTI